MAGDPDPRDLERVGTVLDEKWTLEKLLGSGGMGAVYGARHRNGARAAVKVLHPDLARTPEVRERFLREGYAANRVEHKGAVKVLDDDVVKEGPAAGMAYLVMELLDGESLDERARRKPSLGERELLDVVEGVLEVLEVAHANGVIHRDLKPENLFLSRDEDRVRVKVLDFGLARVADIGQATNAGRALGTPSFMSPEQAAGNPEAIDGRTDIFALGSTLFQLISGRRIHEADNIVHLVIKMASLPAPPLKTIVPRVSDSFAKIVDRALAYEKTDRYPDAATMRADVRAVIDELGGGPSSLGLVRSPFLSQAATTEISASELEEIVSNDVPAARAGEQRSPEPRAARDAVSDESSAIAGPWHEVPANVTAPGFAGGDALLAPAVAVSREAGPDLDAAVAAAIPKTERETAVPAARRAAPAEPAKGARTDAPEPVATFALRPTVPAAHEVAPSPIDSSPPSDERDDSAITSSAPRERPRRSRLWMLVVTMLGGIGVWLTWPDLKARLGPYVPADIADIADASSAFFGDGASTLGATNANDLSDASTAAATIDASMQDASTNADLSLDAAADASIDASADGGDGGADDDDDDDDDDDADGGSTASDGGSPRPFVAPAAKPAWKPAWKPPAKPKPKRQWRPPGTKRRRRHR